MSDLARADDTGGSKPLDAKTAGGIGAAGGGIVGVLVAVGIRELFITNPQVAFACLALILAFSLVVIYLNLNDGARQRIIGMFIVGAFALAVMSFAFSQFRPASIQVRFSVNPSKLGDKTGMLWIDNADASYGPCSGEAPCVIRLGSRTKPIIIRQGDTVEITATDIDDQLETLSRQIAARDEEKQAAAAREEAY